MKQYVKLKSEVSIPETIHKAHLTMINELSAWLCTKQLL